MHLNTDSLQARIPFYHQFKFKLYGLVTLSVLVFVIYEAFDIANNKQTMYNNERDRMIYINHEFVSLMGFYESRIRSGELTREDARKRAFNVIEQMQQQQVKELALNPEVMSILPSTSIIDSATGKYIVHLHPPLKGKNAFAQEVGNLSEPALSQALEAALQKRIAGMRAAPDRTIAESFDRYSTQSKTYETSLSVLTLYEDWGVIILTSTWMSDIDTIIQANIWFSIAMVALIAIFLFIISIVIVRSVTRQIGGEPLLAIRAMKEVQTGNLSIEIPSSTPNSLLHELKSMVGELRKMIIQIRTGSSNISENAQQIFESSQKVTQAAAEQTAQTTEMAAAIEELTVSVAQISESSNNTQKFSEDVAKLCHSSGILVQNSSDGMHRISTTMEDASTKISLLEQQTDQISAITASIKDIADQTNLLALNAAIEAARAGDQGRGFSVVADEVRKLAERTAIATKEIDDMVNTVQLETRQSTKAMENIHPLIQEGTEDSQKVVTALEKINDRANQSLELVTEVAHAASEQSQASQTIAMKVEHISRMVEETQQVIQSTNVSVSRLQSISNELDVLTHQFKV